MLVQLIYCYNSASFISKTGNIFNKWNYHKSRLKKQWKIINTAWSTPQGKGNVLRCPFLPTTPPPISNNFWPKCNWIALRKFPALYINRSWARYSSRGIHLERTKLPLTAKGLEFWSELQPFRCQCLLFKWDREKLRPAGVRTGLYTFLFVCLHETSIKLSSDFVWSRLTSFAGHIPQL